MKTTIKLLCLLMCLGMLLPLATGCQKQAAEADNDALLPENRCTKPAVLAYEEWLNFRLAELGYPLTVTFLQPDEASICEAVVTYSGTDADIYSDYLFFYLLYQEDGGEESGVVPYTCVSLKENAPEELFTVHREISRIAPTYFNANITAELVDTVFAPEPIVNAQPATTLLGDSSYVYTYGNDETFAATFFQSDAYYPFELRTNPVTNRVWFFSYMNQSVPEPGHQDLSGLEACTHQEILDLQQVINDACAREGYPLECDFARDGNVKARFRYTGTGEDIYTPHLYMYADVYDSGSGEGETIHSLGFQLGGSSDYPPESAEVYEMLCAAISTHFFPFAPQGTAKLLFDLETEAAVNKAAVPGVYTVPVVGASIDGFMRGYGISENSVYFRLTSYPTGLYDFYCFPLQKPNTPSLTAEEFRQRLEDALELPVYSAPNEIDEGYTEALHISITGEDKDVAAVVSIDMHYGERSRLLNRILVSTHIWADSEEEKALATPEILSRITAAILSACDGEMDAEAFATFCAPFYTGDWNGPETAYYDFSDGNIACRFYTEDSTTCCEIDLLATENGKNDTEFSTPFVTVPCILDLQQLINDTLTVQDYPIECIGFTNDGTYMYTACFRYIGEDGDVYGTRDFNLYVNAAPGTDTPSDFNFPVWAEMSPQGAQVHMDICKAAVEKYLPDADLDKVELLFAIKPDFTPGYTSQPDPQVSAYMYEESDCFIREYYVGKHEISYVTFSSGGRSFGCDIPHTVPLTAMRFTHGLDLSDILSEDSEYHYSFSYNAMWIAYGDNNVATIDVAPASGALKTIDIYSDTKPALIPQLFAASVGLWDEDANTNELVALCEDALKSVSQQAQVFHSDELIECSVVLTEGVPHCVITFLAEPRLDL